jgi:hypothetical protein
MLAIVVHDVVGSDEGRHIAARLPGQVGIDFPVVGLSACTVNGFVDIAWSAVVGSNDEVPVAENLIEVAQHVGSSIGTFDGVAPFVNE